MNRKWKWSIVALTMCLSLQPQITAFAASTDSDANRLAAQEIGPGITMRSWER